MPRKTRFAGGLRTPLSRSPIQPETPLDHRQVSRCKMKACVVIAVILALGGSADCRKLRGTSSTAQADAKADGGLAPTARDWVISATAPQIGMSLAGGFSTATGQMAKASLATTSVSDGNSATVDLESVAAAEKGSVGTATAAGATWATTNTAFGTGLTSAGVTGQGLTTSKGKEQAASVSPGKVTVAKGEQQALSLGEHPSTLVSGTVLTTKSGIADSASKSLAKNKGNKAQGEAGAGAAGWVPVSPWLKSTKANTNTKATTLPRSASADAFAEALGLEAATSTATSTKSGNP
ncbi:hypothetical protein D9Q98_001755 [Chlorella vulgaris]|uniref:Uncharacterized protein n=1 Tax=Chlorella vulgaris TaxID=3077 RepID=A0A9D4TWC2_CHLVU|nr:hypothetical protein D9Q98_001755 [Chlorella vulgaris]